MTYTNGGPAVLQTTVLIDREIIKLSLERDIWSALQEIEDRENASLDDICASVLKVKPLSLSLTEALRSFAINYFRDAATEEGHWRANHGMPLEYEHCMIQLWT